MLKPQKLKKGDKVAIVSLSRGLLGNDSVKHELDIAIKRLKEFGLIPVIMPNALKSFDYLLEHPEARAQDLKDAFKDDSIKCIISSIGGFDTFRTYEYLLEDNEFIENVKKHPKIFTGFSDTTMNHLMFYKLGLETFYGPCIIVDFAELDKEMLPYTKEYFELFFKDTKGYEIYSSPVWYKGRENYGVEQIGTSRPVCKEEHGYELLNGKGKVTGTLYGGCIDTIYQAFTGKRFYGDYDYIVDVVKKYDIIPTIEEFKEMILFLEPSDYQPNPEEFKNYLIEFKNRQILQNVKGIIFGKPQDEKYYEEYKEVFKEIFSDIKTPVLYNVNFGHSVPKCIIPYGATATVDFDNKKIHIDDEIFDNKKVNLYINGSNRKHNSYNLLNMIKEKDDILISLDDLKINHCIGCNSCQLNDNKCIINDDMQKIYELIEQSNKIIIMSPIYMNFITGILKNVIDRFNPFCASEKLKSKKIMLITVGQMNEKEQQEVVDKLDSYFKSIADFLYFDFEYLYNFTSGDIIEIDDISKMYSEEELEIIINEIKNKIKK